jgi:hypothetical protein
MTTETDPARALLRHTLATLAYRGGKAIREVDENFPTFRAGDKTRAPVEILAHIGDLLSWALSIAKGNESWSNPEPQAWDQEVARFFSSLKAFDDFLASDEPMAVAPERIFQAPIADALTHVGQIAMLRRLAGTAMRGENYFQADITVGRVGAEQSAPRREFD